MRCCVWKSRLIGGGTAVLLITFLFLAKFLHGRSLRLLTPNRIIALETPDNWHIPVWEDVQLKTEDGLQLSGWFIPPDVEYNGATLILIHGLNSNRGQMLEQATMLAAHGYGALLFDLRAHGLSEGTRSSWGAQEWLDVKAAIAFLAERPSVNPDRIGIIGHSMGGAVAIHAAAQLPQLKVVVAESAFTSIEDNAERLTVSFARLPEYMAPIVLWDVKWSLETAVPKPIDDVNLIAPRPILFIHGEQDGTLPASNSQRLYAAAGEPKTLYLIPDADHNDLFNGRADIFERQVIRFLDVHLGLATN